MLVSLFGRSVVRSVGRSVVWTVVSSVLLRLPCRSRRHPFPWGGVPGGSCWSAYLMASPTAVTAAEPTEAAEHPLLCTANICVRTHGHTLTHAHELKRYSRLSAYKSA